MSLREEPAVHNAVVGLVFTARREIPMGLKLTKSHELLHFFKQGFFTQGFFCGGS